MVNKRNIKIGDYVRWLYPLGYVNIQKHKCAQGLIIDIKGEDDRIDGLILCVLDCSYNQSFWLSLDLLIDLGQLQVLNNGKWEHIKRNLKY